MSRRKSFLRGARWPAAFAFVAVSIILVAYAMTGFSVPSWTVQGPIAATSSLCGGVLVGPTDTPPPGSGAARFDCGGPSTAPAFTVTAAGSDVASFTLQPGQTEIGYVDHSAADCSSMITLASSVQVQLAAGSYDLCISYSVSTATTFAAGNVLSWSS